MTLVHIIMANIGFSQIYKMYLVFIVCIFLLRQYTMKKNTLLFQLFPFYQVL
jgi:hypothetical protein